MPLKVVMFTEISFGMVTVLDSDECSTERHIRE